MGVSENTVQFEYSVYNTKDESSMVTLLSRVFTDHDPLAVALNIAAQEFEALLKWWSPKVAAEGLTTIARRTDTGEIVAVMFVEDAATNPPPGMEQLSDRFDPIFAYLGHLDSQYRGDIIPQPGESAHLVFCGVDDQFAGQGLAQSMMTNGMQYVFSKGYKTIVAEATSRKSQHIAKKFGFTEKATVPYADFEFEGQRVFASVAEEGGSILMELSHTTFGANPNATAK